MAEPTQRRAETRQRILAAASDLFREHGIDGIGVDAVMKEAGLTHGGFYLHFLSKEALAAEVSQFLLEKAASKWDRISRSPDREAALEAIVRDYLDPERQAVGHALGGMLDALSTGATAETRVSCACHHGWCGGSRPPCRRPGPVASVSSGRRRQHPSGQSL